MLLHHHHYVSAANFLLPGCCHRSLHGGNKGFSHILLFPEKPAIFAHATIFTHPTVFTLPTIFTQPNIPTHFFFQSFNFILIFGSFVFIPQMSSIGNLFVCSHPMDEDFFWPDISFRMQASYKPISRNISNASELSL